MSKSELEIVNTVKQKYNKTYITNLLQRDLFFFLSINTNYDFLHFSFLHTLLLFAFSVQSNLVLLVV